MYICFCHFYKQATYTKRQLTEYTKLSIDQSRYTNAVLAHSFTSFQIKTTCKQLSAVQSLVMYGKIESVLGKQFKIVRSQIAQNVQFYDELVRIEVRVTSKDATRTTVE